MFRPRATSLVFAILAAGIMLGAACDHGPEQKGRATRPVPAASPLIQAAVASQDSLLASTLPAAPWAPDVRRFFQYSILLYDPDRRPAARESFFAEWAATPDHLFFVEVAFIHRSRLAHPKLREDLLKAAAGSDTNAAMYHFVQGRRDWRRVPGTEIPLHRASALAAGHNPLLAVWSQIRAAGAVAQEGLTDEAIRELVQSIQPAWDAGGAILAGSLWIEISRISRQAGLLDDALAAASMAEACGTACGNGYLHTRARLSKGRAHLQRSRFAAATNTFADCYTTASDSGYVRLVASASGLLARVAHAYGDLDRETNEIQRLLGLTRASADTNGMLLAAAALASGLRRSGDLDGAAFWFDWSDTVNSKWTTGDHTQLLRRQRAILLTQIGRYAAADSLRSLVGQDKNSTLNPDEAILLQINLILQGLESDRPDIAYRALARARELTPGNRPRSGSYDSLLELALAAAQLHARQGEYHLAYGQLQAAADRAVKPDPHTSWFMTDTRGKVALAAGDGATALHAFGHCVALADTLGEPDLMRRSRVRLSRALLSEARYSAAESLVTGDCGAPEYWTRLNARLVKAMALAGAGDHEGALVAFAAADTALGEDAPSDLAARLALERGRSLAALGIIPEAYALLASTRQILDAPNARSTTELGKSFNQNIRYEVAEALLGLYHDHPRGTGHANATAAREVAAWARHQTPASASGPRLEYFVGPSRAFVWATRGAGEKFNWEEIATRQELTRLADAVNTDMGYPGRAVDTRTAERLGAILFGPLAGHWEAGSTLEIAPDGLLTALPWAALPWPGTSQAALFHGPLVITVGSPSPKDRSTGHGLLAIGVNGDADEPAPRLAQAEDEAKAIAATWPEGPVNLLLGAEGSLQGLLPDGFQGYRAIHISSHTRVYEGADGHSAIHVAGEGDLPLTIGQISAAHIGAELVYLSNCEGARQHRSAGRGILSFADAFLAAGSGGVVATSVLVDDDAGRVLAEAFYRHWLGGKNRAAALRAALLELKEADPRWQHPFYWAFTNFYTRPAA